MNAWITAPALADASAMLPALKVARSTIPHGTYGMHGIGRYCACCDAFKRGAIECEDCRAPWGRS